MAQTQGRKGARNGSGARARAQARATQGRKRTGAGARAQGRKRTDGDRVDFVTGCGSQPCPVCSDGWHGAKGTDGGEGGRSPETRVRRCAGRGGNDRTPASCARAMGGGSGGSGSDDSGNGGNGRGMGWNDSDRARAAAVAVTAVGDHRRGGKGSGQGRGSGGRARGDGSGDDGSSGYGGGGNSPDNRDNRDCRGRVAPAGQEGYIPAHTPTGGAGSGRRGARRGMGDWLAGCERLAERGQPSITRRLRHRRYFAAMGAAA